MAGPGVLIGLGLMALAVRMAGRGSMAWPGPTAGWVPMAGLEVLIELGLMALAGRMTGSGPVN
ncbi:hypothetical protein OG226_15760 [Streptomyces sp. NBC_01261]|uniref:hypothetical protein n=1 Tax=unclassified Streptomyces TaxID=2593676 RepID=UPI002E2A6217|nr:MULTISPECIES: hypothetical protein [unclassified Streptomyces]